MNFEDSVITPSHKQLLIADFTAKWCRPCLTLTPILRDVEYEFRGIMKVEQIDVDTELGLVDRFDVKSIPTLLFIKNGEVVHRTIGAQPRETIVELIAAYKHRD